MSFREKMAWIMLVALIVFGAIYFVPIALSFGTTGFLRPVSTAVGTLAVIALIVVATSGAIVAALSNVTEANMPVDEREAKIIARSENYGGAVLGACTVAIVIAAHVTVDLGWIVPALIASLTLSHLVTNFAQIALFRSY